jgi:hypothetical protein
LLCPLTSWRILLNVFVVLYTRYHGFASVNLTKIRKTGDLNIMVF